MSEKKDCGEYKHCYHNIGDKCTKREKYEGLKVYTLKICCECFNITKELEWD